MSIRQTTVTASTAPAIAQTTGLTLQRKCDCGQHTVAGGACSECEEKKGTLQSKSSTSEPANDVPPIVHQVLRSPGQPLDAATRAFMEPRFGHDFSSVRVHADAKAAESARAVDALAYTVGREMVFGHGQYAPESAAGRQVLAHELTHVVQQQKGRGQSAEGTRSSVINDQGLEAEADHMAAGLSLGMTTTWPIRPMRQVAHSSPANTRFALQRQKNTGAASVSRPTLRARDFKVDHTFFEFVAHDLSYVDNLDGKYLYRAYRSDEPDAPKTESGVKQAAFGGPKLTLPGVTPDAPADVEDRFVFMSNPPETPPPIPMVGGGNPPFYYHIHLMEDSDQGNKDTGLVAYYLIPSRNTEPRILVFRGTEPERPDIKDDANKGGVGAGSFKDHRGRIETTLNEMSKMRGSKTVVSGHSLGGALAQRATAANPSKVAELVTFNSPGVSGVSKDKENDALSEFADKSKTLANKPKVTYYVTKGDIVSTAGGARLPGTAIMMEGRPTKQLRAMLEKGMVKAAGDALEVLYVTIKSLAKNDSTTSQIGTLLSTLKSLAQSGAIWYAPKLGELMGALHSQRILRASQITPQELSPPKWQSAGVQASLNWRAPAPDIKDLAEKAGEVKMETMPADELSVPLNSAALATLANLSFDNEIDVVFDEVKPLIERVTKEPLAALALQARTGQPLQVIAQKTEPLLRRLVMVIKAAGGLETLMRGTLYDKPEPVFEKPTLSTPTTYRTTPGQSASRSDDPKKKKEKLYGPYVLPEVVVTATYPVVPKLVATEVQQKMERFSVREVTFAKVETVEEMFQRLDALNQAASDQLRQDYLRSLGSFSNADPEVEQQAADAQAQEILEQFGEGWGRFFWWTRGGGQTGQDSPLWGILEGVSGFNRAAPIPLPGVDPVYRDRTRTTHEIEAGK